MNYNFITLFICNLMLLSGTAAVAVPQARDPYYDPYKRSEITFQDVNLGLGFSSVAFPSNILVGNTWSYVGGNDFVVNIVFVGPYPAQNAGSISRDFEEPCRATRNSEYFNCVRVTANKLGLGLIGRGDKYVTVIGKAKNLTRNHAASSADLLEKFVDPYRAQKAKNWITSTTTPFYTLFDPNAPNFNNITAPRQ